MEAKNSHIIIGDANDGTTDGRGRPEENARHRKMLDERRTAERRKATQSHAAGPSDGWTGHFFGLVDEEKWLIFLTLGSEDTFSEHGLNITANL